MLSRVVLGLAFMGIAAQALAVPFKLEVGDSCNEGAPSNGIQVGDVWGNSGGATECWGTYDGNDSVNDGFEVVGGTYDGAKFDYVAKENTPGALEGSDIGLKVTPKGGAKSGSWEFNQGALGGRDFLIVLKAASKPGFAAWLFAGNPDATSYAGTWKVAWDKDLSHLSIYQSTKDPRTPPNTPPNGVPTPTPLALLAIGLVAAIRRVNSGKNK